MSFARDFVDFGTIRDLLILGLLTLFTVFWFPIPCCDGSSLFLRDLSWWRFCWLSIVELFGIVLLSSILFGMEWTSLGFYSFSFVGGLRGAEPSSLLWGQSFLSRFLIAETHLLMSVALHRREVEKGHTFLF